MPSYTSYFKFRSAYPCILVQGILSFLLMLFKGFLSFLRGSYPFLKAFLRGSYPFLKAFKGALLFLKVF